MMAPLASTRQQVASEIQALSFDSGLNRAKRAGSGWADGFHDLALR